MRELLFVCCTAGQKHDTILMRSLAKLGGQKAVFFESISVRYSSCYNHILNSLATPDQIVVFVREDVLIADTFIQDKLNQAVDSLGFAVVGVAGAKIFNFDEKQPSTEWAQVPPANLAGAIEYAGVGIQNNWRCYGPAPARCIALDDALVAVDPKRIGALRFDERFETEFNVLDLCLQAHFAGLMLGASNIHVNRKPESLLRANPRYLAAQKVFRAKWRDRLRASAEQTK
jgi:hypothetical protein